MNKQEKGSNETQEMTAKNLLKKLLESRGCGILKLEGQTPREAVARVNYSENQLGLVTAEVVDEESGIWFQNTIPSHPNRFNSPSEIPIPAAKAETLNESAVHVIFSSNGGCALLFKVEDLLIYGKHVPAVKGKEAVYVLPASHCLIFQRRV